MTFDILSRLPVKLLPRFKCACKAWMGQIENPSFNTDHYNKALKSYFRLLVWQIYVQRGKASFHPLLFLVLVGETLDPVENQIAHQFFRVLVIYRDWDGITLWNFATRV